MALTFSIVAAEIYAAWISLAKLRTTFRIGENDEFNKNKRNIINVLYLTISEPLNLKNKNGERIAVDSEKAGEIMKGAKPHREIIRHCLDNALEASMPAVIEQNIIRYLDPNKIDTLIDHLQQAVLEDSDLYNSVKKDILEKASRTYLPVFLMRVIQYSLNKWNISEDMIHSKDCSYVNQQPETSHNSVKIVSRLIAPVSKENYVSRRDIECLLAQSLQTNKFTIIRGLSGLGKSELARRIATAENSVFSTVIHLRLSPKGEGEFTDLIDQQVGITPLVGDPLKTKKNLLQAADSSFLIIVDNFNGINNWELISALANSTGNARILITSQIQKTKLNTLVQKYCISVEVVDLEADEYIYEEFAPSIFCSYANLNYQKLIPTQQAMVVNICNLVKNHTMIVAALGARLKEYCNSIGTVLAEMQSSIIGCLKRNLPVEIPKDFDDEWRTPYEILKGLFAGLLSKPFNELERQVLGAMILLPQHYHERSVLEELVGDLKEIECSDAKGAVNNLLRCEILQINTNGILELHPLYMQLFSDPQNAFCNENGVRQCGPIAELSADFAFHLLSNEFVSNIILDDYYSAENGFFEEDVIPCTDRLWKNGYINSLVRSKRNWFSEIMNQQNYSWIYFWYIYDAWHCDPVHLLTAVAQNHGVDGRGYEPEEMPLFFPTEHEVFSYQMELNWIASQKGIRPSSLSVNTTVLKRHGFYEVVAHGKFGRAVFVHDIETDEDWCILNKSEQRLRDNRYFKASKNTSAQNGKLYSADITGFHPGSRTPTLFAGESEKHGVSITFKPINYRCSNTEAAHQTIPLKSVCALTWLCPDDVTSVFLPDGLKSIGSSAFESAVNLRYISIPDSVDYIGVVAFEKNPKLLEVELPLGIRLGFGLCCGYEHYYSTGTLGFDINVDEDGHLQLVWDLITNPNIKSVAWEGVDFPFDDDCRITIRTTNDFGEDIDIVTLLPQQ